MRHQLLAAALVLLPLACTPEPKERSEIAAPLHEALDRAEAVGQTLEEHARDLRRELEEAEGRNR